MRPIGASTMRKYEGRPGPAARDPNPAVALSSASAPWNPVVGLHQQSSPVGATLVLAASGREAQVLVERPAMTLRPMPPNWGRTSAFVALGMSEARPDPLQWRRCSLTQKRRNLWRPTSM